MTDDRRMTKEQAGQLYDEYGGRLYRLALMILWDSGSAEDAVHQVFAKLLSRRGGSKYVQSWERYLTRAVSNECRGILRQRKRVLSSPLKPSGNRMTPVIGGGVPVASANYRTVDITAGRQLESLSLRHIPKAIRT